MASSTPTKKVTKIGMYEHELEFLNWVFQSFESEPKINYQQLQDLSGMSKSAVQAKWWRLRQKYMPQVLSPKKRKVDEDGDDDGGDGKTKLKAKSTPKKTKTQKSKEDVEENCERGAGGPREV